LFDCIKKRHDADFLSLAKCKPVKSHRKGAKDAQEIERLTASSGESSTLKSPGLESKFRHLPVSFHHRDLTHFKFFFAIFASSR
jgi:hypothetical protein